MDNQYDTLGDAVEDGRRRRHAPGGARADVAGIKVLNVEGGCRGREARRAFLVVEGGGSLLWAGGREHDGAHGGTLVADNCSHDHAFHNTRESSSAGCALR
jgi:hypothetical protein